MHEMLGDVIAVALALFMGLRLVERLTIFIVNFTSQ
jgi:hypothetical protein